MDAHLMITAVDDIMRSRYNEMETIILVKNVLYEYMKKNYGSYLENITFDEFYKNCYIEDYGMNYIDDYSKKYYHPYFYVDYVYTEEFQCVYIDMDKMYHKNSLHIVHNELYRNIHKKQLNIIHEDMLSNYWNYDNIELWKYQLEYFKP